MEARCRLGVREESRCCYLSVGLERPKRARSHRGPDAMEQNCQLACHCNDRFVLGLLATSGGQMQTPHPKRRVLPMWAKNMVCTLDQQTSEIDVASFCDAELRITITRLASSRS